MRTLLYDQAFALECVQYILEFEEEDFKENPDTNHIYFKAYAALHGIKEAKEMLWETTAEADRDAMIDNAIDFRRGK